MATRTGEDIGGLVPTLMGHASLAVAVTAYEMWLVDDMSDLQQLLEKATDRLENILASRSPATVVGCA